MCVSTVFGLSQSARQMPWFERPSAISARISRSRDVSSSIGSTRRRRASRSSTTARSTTHSPAADPLHGVEQLFDPTDAFLHQIADAFGLGFDELERVVGLEVLREDEDGGARVARTDFAGCAQSFVRMGGGHPDVDEGDVRVQVADAAKQGICVADLIDDLDAVFREQTGDSLADERCVVGDYDPHGKKAHTFVPRPASLSIDNVASSASSRSRRPARPDSGVMRAPPTPSSVTVTRSVAGSRSSSTDASSPRRA